MRVGIASAKLVKNVPPAFNLLAELHLLCIGLAHFIEVFRDPNKN
jgi:hypothetical protein